MAICKKKRFTRTELCAGDLRHKIDIQTRTLGGVSFGQTSASETFTTIFSPWAAIETISGFKKFSGINIDERATDVFYIRFSTAVAALEVANHFILFDGKRFRILEVTDLNRDKRTLAIQCTDRGDDTLDASEA